MLTIALLLASLPSDLRALAVRVVDLPVAVASDGAPVAVRGPNGWVPTVAPESAVAYETDVSRCDGRDLAWLPDGSALITTPTGRCLHLTNPGGYPVAGVVSE